MNGCIIGSPNGFAGFVETSGSGLFAYEDGVLELTREYVGPPANVRAFLAAFPEGTPDAEFPELTRTTRYSVSYDEGWAYIGLGYGGSQTLSAEARPFRVTKSFAERSVSLKLTPGLFGDDSGTERVVAELKYTTLLHSVEYSTATDLDEASKFSSVDLPTLPNDAIHITNCSPGLELAATGYIGGNWNPPAGRTAILSEGADYSVYYQAVDFERTKDRGALWQVRESWAAIVINVEETPPP